MSDPLFVFVTAASVLLLLLAAVLHRKQPKTSLALEGETGGESRTILTSLDLSLPSRLLADRIFAQDDWDFVCRGAASLEQAFLKERKKIALLWLKDTRICVRNIFRFYRIAVRSSAALQFWTELRIAGNYFLFLFMVSGVESLIYLRGPFYARGMILRMFATADRVSTAAGRTLAALDPSSVARIKDDWARQAAPAD